MSKFSYYDTQTIDTVFALQGKATSPEAEDQTGVPQSTIRGWWSGRCDPYRQRGGTYHKGGRCRKGHPRTPENTYVRCGGTKRNCRVCELQSARKNRLRTMGVQHRYYYPGDVILESLSDVDFRGLSTHYPSKARYILRLRSGEQKWVSVEKADELLCHFGLTIHMLPSEPRQGYPNQAGGMR